MYNTTVYARDCDLDKGELLEHMIQFPTLIQKKICKGSSTGDVLLAIITGQDGDNHHQQYRNEAVMTRLQSIAKLADLSNSGGETKVRNCCRKCNKMEETLHDFLRCSRCGYATYCSKECQVTHWTEEHKRLCRPRTENHVDHPAIDEKLVNTFVEENYFEIAKEVIAQMPGDAVFDGGEREAFLALDFWAGPIGAAGIAPALRSPPEFKVYNVYDYLESKEVSQFLLPVR